MKIEFEPCPFCGLELESVGETVKFMQHPLTKFRCPASRVYIEISPEPDIEIANLWNHRVVTKESVIESMAKIVEELADEILEDIKNTTSDFEADDLSGYRDEELARADYIRSFLRKI